MKKYLFTVIAAAALTSCTLIGFTHATGNGVSADTVIDVGEFDAVSSEGSISVICSQSERETSVVLTCDENLAEFYKIEVIDGTLRVKTKPMTSLSHKVKSYVTITTPKLNGISVSGSGKCQITSPINSNGDVNLKVSGSGAINAEGAIKCKDFSLRLSGSGAAHIAGVQAGTALFKTTGSGAIHADNITVENTTATSSGSGSLYLGFKNAGSIDVSLSGSGSAHLSGNAHSLKSNTTGSGRVDSRDLSLSGIID